VPSFGQAPRSWLPLAVGGIPKALTLLHVPKGAASNSPGMWPPCCVILGQTALISIWSILGRKTCLPFITPASADVDSGNGEDYKQIPNAEKAWEVDAYPTLLSAVRAAIGPEKLISAAVPGLPRDMLGFTSTTLPSIMESVDFLNVMTYDLMNRRDNLTKHHTGIQLSLESIMAYMANGAPSQMLNLGFAFYVKYFRISKENHDICLTRPIGCLTGPMEDPETGADLGKSGGFSWHDPVPEDVQTSFAKVLRKGTYDDVDGGYYYFDPEEDLWWTFDTPDAILRKFSPIVEAKKLGGVFAWGLGEDAPEFRHLQALNQGLERLSTRRDEL
jgi:GH18 family chitinase